jgi:NDP-sugar pyrophosphorylase family protein
VIGDWPKPMAPVHDRPFLEYQLRLLRRQGVTRTVLCAGYRHELIQAYFGDGTGWEMQITYVVEARPLGTGGALRLARPHLTDRFLALNGDTYFATDLARLTASHRAAAAIATMALVAVPDVARYGAVIPDDAGRVLRFDEKGRTGPGLINAGVYLFEPAVFDRFTDQTPLSLEQDVFPRLAAERVLHGCELYGYHVDIGTPQSYAQFADYIADQARRGEAP